jgi:AhpD family alkylhydroperoxidase
MKAQEQQAYTMIGEGSVMGELDALRRRTMEPGALPQTTKELIALAVALRGGNDTSIAYHVHNAMEAGCSAKDISETVDIAAMVAGEAAAVHAVQVQKALQENVASGPGESSFRQFAEVYDQ